MDTMNNKLNNLILEQLIRSTIQQHLLHRQTIQEQEGPSGVNVATDSLINQTDLTPKNKGKEIKDPADEKKRKAVLAAQDKAKLNMDKARAFSKLFKNNTTFNIDFTKVTVDGKTPIFATRGEYFKVGDITYTPNLIWTNTKQKMEGSYSIDKYRVITDAGKSIVKVDTASLTNSEVNTLMVSSVKLGGKVDAKLIANIIKGAPGFWSDNESRANIAFLSIKDSAHYYEVKRYLKASPWQFIQGFMNTSEVYENSEDFSAPSYFNNKLQKQDKGWASCDKHLYYLNLPVTDHNDNPEAYKWGLKNPLGNTGHKINKLFLDKAGEKLSKDIAPDEKTNTFIQYLGIVLAIGGFKFGLKRLKSIIKKIFPEQVTEIFASTRKNMLQIKYSELFMTKFPGYNQTMVSYDKLNRFTWNFFDRQLATLKTNFDTSIKNGTKTKSEVKELVDIFAENKVLIMQNLKNKLIRDLFKQHLKRNSKDAAGKVKELWTANERTGVLEANRDFLQIVPVHERDKFKAALDTWVAKHTAPVVAPPPVRGYKKNKKRR